MYGQMLFETTRALIVDPDFQAAIPPPTPEEKSALENSLIFDGCRDALVTWDGILIDGHNRYDICTRRNIPFKTIEMEFDSRELVLDWIDSNQLARRNLTPDQMSLLRGRRYNRTKKPVNDGGQGTPKATVGQNDLRLSTAEILASQYGVSDSTIKRDGQFSGSVEKLKPVIPDVEQRVMSGEISKKAIIEAAREPETAAEKLKPHVANNSGDNEWYTPPHIVEAARKTMGRIDYDPASCAIAQNTVQACHYFTIETDGLKQQWGGAVWMNPPYSDLIKLFVAAVVEKYVSGEIEMACVLVNNATETAWFRKLLGAAKCVCFLRSRVKFNTPEGQGKGTPLQGQAVVYFGDNNLNFIQYFSDLGVILHV